MKNDHIIYLPIFYKQQYPSRYIRINLHNIFMFSAILYCVPTHLKSISNHIKDCGGTYCLHT